MDASSVIPVRGPVGRREVLALAVPAAAGAILHNAFRPLDQFFVAGLGMEAQGALGSMAFVMIMAYGAFLLVSAGAAPLVARATGAGDTEERRRVIGAALFGCAVVAVVLAVVGVAASGSIAALLGLEGPTAAHATVYLRTIFLTAAAIVFAPTIDASFQSMGNTWLPTALQVASLTMNAVLTPLLIYGAGLGVAGAALGTTISQTVTVLLGGTLLWRRVGLGWHHVRPGPTLARILRIGAPIAVGTASYAAVYWAMLATSISPLGPAVNAGLGIGFNALEAMSWPLFLGLSIAGASIVGRRLGAGEPEEAWRAVRLLALPALLLGTAVGATFWFAARPLVGLFAADDDAFREAVLYASVLAWSQPFVAIEALTEGILNGAGATRRTFFGTLPFNLLRVPLAWWMAFPLGMGAAGIWWAINLTSFLKALTKSALVAEGGWARIQV